MLRSQKRKSRWSSKSLFGFKAANKIVVVERLTDGNEDGRPDANAVLNMSLDGCSTEDGHLRITAAEKFRRNGSKVLSILGWRQNSGKAIVSTTSHQIADPDARQSSKPKHLKHAQRA